MDQPRFSPRERQVLKLFAKGKSQKEIGEELGISDRTVNTYLTTARVRAGQPSSTALLVLAVREGWV
jgi:RNA polymerase sigma factor (sigma-70 family)